MIPLLIDVNNNIQLFLIMLNLFFHYHLSIKTNISHISKQTIVGMAIVYFSKTCSIEFHS